MATLPRVGDQFGRYRIDSQIGRGGMGVVFRATDRSIDRRVALKVVAANLGGSPEFRARFEREAALLARLDSPHVIAIYDYGTQDECPYIATQFVGGGDLGALLHERGPMPAALALRLCAQVADALYDAHRVGVVHRDVKPTNVLLRDADSPDLHAYLCDFGIARTATDGLTAPGAVAGTWSYLSPECGRGAPGTPASDVYALGCLLWATLSGSPPYRGSDVEIAVAHQRDPVPQVLGEDRLAGQVNAILSRSMAKDPAQRHDDADQLRTALLAAAALPEAENRLLELPVVPAPTSTPTSRPASTPPGGSTPRLTPTPAGPPRRRAATVGLAVAAVLVVAGGALAATRLVGGDGAEDTSATDTPSATGSPASTGPSGEPTEEPTGGPFVAERVDRGGPIAGDLDGDGLGDVSVDFDAREPDATLTTTWSSTGTGLEEVATDDLAPYGQGRGVWRLAGRFDDDEVTDVLVFRQPDGESPVGVTGDLSGGGRVDTRLPGGPRDLDTFDAVGDADGDGRDDLLTLEVTAENRIVLSTWAFDGSTFAAPRVDLTLRTDDPYYTHLRPGDLDGDDVEDLVVLQLTGDYDESDFLYPGTLEVRLGDGKGGYEPAASADVRFSSTTLFLRTGDFDGDEADEILVGDPDGGFIVLSSFDLDGDQITSTPAAGTIRYSQVTPFGPDVAISDVDGDGRDDVVSVGPVRTGGTGRVFAALAGDGSFASRRWLAWDQVFAERRGDGRLELLDGARW